MEKCEMKIKLFGKFKDLLNQDEIIYDLEEDEMKFQDIINHIEEKYGVNLKKLTYKMYVLLFSQVMNIVNYLF